MQYEKSFKEQAVKLFDEIGVKAVANQLESLTILFHLEKSAKKNMEQILMLAVAIKEYLRITKSSVFWCWKKKMRNSNIPMSSYSRHSVFSPYAERSKSSSALPFHLC
ncbi:TPA: hypothetical protein U1C42_001815 [Streptococcus suis]|nr:hypothetical protein [Streptococcus suis]HEM3659694.1 hypothetical protein [Streptococcus suis]